MARSARIALDLALAITKTLRPMFTTAWQYAKVEVAPPMTVGYLQGPAGQKLEEAVSKVCDGFISGIEGSIKEIDLAEERAIKEKEAAIRAEQEKLKTQAKKKEQEKKRKEAENKAKKAKKSEAKAKETPPKKEEKKKDAKKK
ncbi:hypothetical protein K1T71_003146 [Dendrolimus kikuchii]|uniref:Uncharacterized protein n=1 Tax=Dendrolimus kikuchii TaxID=765133 RepID=A0ACC1DAZ8_9NEOP|nr:hypothetical protein K1T71_003146 [Dendrolimus kikuchii]